MGDRGNIVIRQGQNNMKTPTQYTPGPWKIASDYVMMQKGRADIVAWANQTCPLARVVCGTLTSVQDPAESIANACLIAAAPDLLAALQELVAIICGGERDVTLEDCDEAKAAIAKATEGI